MKAILILYNNSERELYVKNLKIEVKIIESSSKGKERFIEFKSSEIPKEIIISKKKNLSRIFRSKYKPGW